MFLDRYCLLSGVNHRQHADPMAIGFEIYKCACSSVTVPNPDLLCTKTLFNGLGHPSPKPTAGKQTTEAPNLKVEAIKVSSPKPKDITDSPRPPPPPRPRLHQKARSALNRPNKFARFAVRALGESRGGKAGRFTLPWSAAKLGGFRK